MMCVQKLTTRITNEERETLLRFDYLKNQWIMDSTVPKHYNKALKQGWKLHTKFIYDDGKIAGMVLTAPANAISIKNPNINRTLTEEQRIAAAERLKNYRNSNK